jgi:hypothetical protein
MKNLIFCILIFTAFGCITSQNKIDVTPINSDTDCKMCPGKLIVSNGIKTDSIVSGQWGNPPMFQNLQDRYLVLNNDYNFSGGLQIKLINIYSLDTDGFLKPILDKEIVLYDETQLNENGGLVTYVYTNNPEVLVSDSVVIKDRISIKRCPELLGHEGCQIIENFEQIESIKLAF